jgi:hypothetical protein
VTRLYVQGRNEVNKLFQFFFTLMQQVDFQQYSAEFSVQNLARTAPPRQIFPGLRQQVRPKGCHGADMGAIWGRYKADMGPP